MAKIKPKSKNSKKPAKKIKIKEQLFIDNYTDTDNTTTLGNGTQSMIAVSPELTYNSARTKASLLLTNNAIQSAIEQQIELIGLGSKVRLQTIKDVITGQDLQETITTTKKLDKEGKETGERYEATTIKTPRASDKLKAIDLLSKIDGTYDKNRVRADVMSSELKTLVRAHRRELTGKGGGGN